MKTDQQKWTEQIQAAKEKKDAWMEEFKVETLRAFFEGKQRPSNVPDEEWITVNKFYSHLMSQLPMLYGMDPYFYIKLKKTYKAAQTPEEMKAMLVPMQAKAQGRQGMLNYLKGELELKSHARLGIMDAHFAFGVLKSRRASDSEDHPHKGEPILDAAGKEMKDESGQTLMYPDTKPVNERYESDRIDPDHILFDADAGPLEKSWSWIGHYFCLSKADALQDKRFTKSVIRKIKGKSRQSEEERVKAKKLGKETKTSFEDDELYIDFYEIYNLKTREWLIYSEDADDLVSKPKSLPAGVEKHPFNFLRFVLRAKSPYPIPPMFPGLDPQREYNMTRSKVQTHRKRFNRKYTALENAVDPDELSKLESGEDGTVITVRMHDAVRPIQDAALNPQDYSEIGLLNADLVELLNSPDATRGIASADSATEAGLIDRRLEVKEGDRMGLVVDWIIDWAKKVDKLVQAYIDKEEAVRVTGPQGELWVTVSPKDYEDIEGEYEYSVNVGATQPRLPDIERSQWIAFLSQVIIPFPAILTKPNLMRRMAEMFHIEDDASIQELQELGQAIVSGMMPMPGQQGGGPPGGSAVSQILGGALGHQGGNANGGGSQVS